GLARRARGPAGAAREDPSRAAAKRRRARLEARANERARRPPRRARRQAHGDGRPRRRRVRQLVASGPRRAPGGCGRAPTARSTRYPELTREPRAPAQGPPSPARRPRGPVARPQAGGGGAPRRPSGLLRLYLVALRAAYGP